MTSEHETHTGLETERTPLPPTPSSEAAYDRLAGYAFARRYVPGKVVAAVG